MWQLLSKLHMLILLTQKFTLMILNLDFVHHPTISGECNMISHSKVKSVVYYKVKVELSLSAINSKSPSLAVGSILNLRCFRVGLPFRKPVKSTSMTNITRKITWNFLSPQNSDWEESFSWGKNFPSQYLLKHHFFVFLLYFLKVEVVVCPKNLVKYKVVQ